MEHTTKIQLLMLQKNIFVHNYKIT